MAGPLGETKALQQHTWLTKYKSKNHFAPKAKPGRPAQHQALVGKMQMVCGADVTSKPLPTPRFLTFL